MEVGEPKRTFIKSIPMGRIEQPEDVTGAVAFLCSDLAGYITGEVLTILGGTITAA